MPRTLVLIRHGHDPEDDRVVAFARSRGFTLDTRRPFAGDPLGPPGPEVAGSVLYGGPFNVFEEDRHPFLHDEARWISACMAGNIPLLGICQGAQQIARLLGAEVGPLTPPVHEFGVYPITPTETGREEGFLPQTLHLVESHFHTFALPQGAVHLASSALYPNQAFRMGATTWALQFHAECTATGFKRWQARPGAPYDQPGTQARAEQDAALALHDAAQAAWFEGFLDRVFGAPT
jgi:GMP synthase (glutamine-hydrolysing)